MCLVAIAWRVHPRYPCILLGNRDEFHARPAAPADWWPDAPEVFGGRDLVAGGSWLGITRAGRIALVTNNPARPPASRHDLSRGALVREWLTGAETAAGYLHHVEGLADRYAGFCLVLGSTNTGLEGLITPAGALGSRWTLAPGITVLSNSPREAPWPKVDWLERALDRYLGRTADGAAAEPDCEALFALLNRRMPVAEAANDTTLARARVTPFVSGPDYGTRASTLILADEHGGWRFIERRFGPGGIPAGESQVRSSPLT